METCPSLLELARQFPTEAAAEAWFIKHRWPGGVRCPRCYSKDIQKRRTRIPAPFRCRACRRDFSVKTESLMHGSPLSYRVWAFAFYLMASHPKGMSSVQLHKCLGITQKTAWFLAHRIRDAYADGGFAFHGPVEVDETYVGGKEKNKHHDKKLAAGGHGGKVPVVGMKDRETNRVSAAVSLVVDRDHLHTFIEGRIIEGAAVYTDDLPAYDGFPHHQSVNHSAKQYVDGEVHTNGIESFWAILKRGIIGVYHHVSPKHLPRYLLEFTGRYNRKGLSIWHQMDCLADGVFVGRRLSYRALVG